MVYFSTKTHHFTRAKIGTKIMKNFKKQANIDLFETFFVHITEFLKFGNEIDTLL